MDTSRRTENLRGVMREKNIDLSIIVDFQNQFYFSGLKAITYTRPIILAIDSTKMSLIVPSLEENHAKTATPADHLLVYHETPLGDDQNMSYIDLFKRCIAPYPKGTRIGVEFSSLSVQLGNIMKTAGLELVNLDDEMTKMRYIKEQQELDRMIESGRLVSLALKHSLENAHAGLTEMEVDQFGNEALFKDVARTHPDSTLDFFVMTPSGIERSVLPHVFSSTRTFKENDISIHSRQVGLNGYRAECERTFFIGKPTDRQADLFKIALEAQNKALDIIKPGIKAKHVDEAARKVFQKYNVDAYSMHRTGHGIGIGNHEEPSLRFDNDLILQEGMAYCVEPGLYVPGVGGFRHSDTVILKEDGSHQITDYPRELEYLCF